VASTWKRQLLWAMTSPARRVLAGRNRLRIVNYHRINDRASVFPLDVEAVSASAEDFDRQVRFCTQNYDVVAFHDLVEWLDGRARLPKRPLIITFDDGYEDNFRCAYPILKAHRVSAMFFVATAYVGTDRLFWWDEVALALNTCTGASFELTVGPDRLRLDVSSSTARSSSTKTVLSALKRIPNPQRLDAIRALSEIRQARRRTDAAIGRQVATWDELRQMQAGGMEIGSHSVTHPILSQVDDDQLRHEVTESKATLEAQLGRPVDVFSYPVGGTASINDAVTACVEEAGYRVAVTYINGVTPLDRPLDRFRIKRLRVDGLDAAAFGLQVTVPGL